MGEGGKEGAKAADVLPRTPRRGACTASEHVRDAGTHLGRVGDARQEERRVHRAQHRSGEAVMTGSQFLDATACP